MKTCSSCKIALVETSFAWRSKNKNKNKRRQSCCKECIKEKTRLHYHNNKPDYQRRAKERDHKIRKFVYDYLLKNPCVDCGEHSPPCLDFDHLRDKKWSISNGVRAKQSIKAITEEIAKCKVRCANCHRKKTAIEQNWYSDL